MKVAWISIKDKMPEDGQQVLIHSMSYVPGTYYSSGDKGDWFKDDGAGEVGKVTHWVDLKDAKDFLEESITESTENVNA